MGLQLESGAAQVTGDLPDPRDGGDISQLSWGPPAPRWAELCVLSCLKEQSLGPGRQCQSLHPPRLPCLPHIPWSFLSRPEVSFDTVFLTFVTLSQGGWAWKLHSPGKSGKRIQNVSLSRLVLPRPAEPALLTLRCSGEKTEAFSHTRQVAERGFGRGARPCSMKKVAVNSYFLEVEALLGSLLCHPQFKGSRKNGHAP